MSPCHPTTPSPEPRAGPRCKSRRAIGQAPPAVKRPGKREVELAVLNNPPSNHQLAMEPYRTEPLVAFVASDHPLSGKKQLTWKDLGRHGFIIRQPLAGSGSTAQFIRRLKDRGVKLKVVMHC